MSIFNHAGRRYPGDQSHGSPCTVAAALPTLILVNQAVAVVCQFVQGTDPRFPLLYFTVDSAILAGVAAALTLVGRKGRWYRRIRLTAMVGVVVSALVFTVVIAPATPTGTWFQPHDDLPVRLATVLMHAVAPVLVTLDYLTRPDCLSVRSSVLWSYLWPFTYLGGLGVLAAFLGPSVIPYPFLRPSLMGWPTVVGAYAALFCLIAVLGCCLCVLRRVVTARFTNPDRSPAKLSAKDAPPEDRQGR